MKRNRDVCGLNSLWSLQRRRSHKRKYHREGSSGDHFHNFQDNDGIRSPIVITRIVVITLGVTVGLSVSRPRF